MRYIKGLRKVCTAIKSYKSLPLRIMFNSVRREIWVDFAKNGNIYPKYGEMGFTVLRTLTEDDAAVAERITMDYLSFLVGQYEDSQEFTV
jgi:hypothetical protein